MTTILGKGGGPVSCLQLSEGTLQVHMVPAVCILLRGKIRHAISETSESRAISMPREPQRSPENVLSCAVFHKSSEIKSNPSQLGVLCALLVALYIAYAALTSMKHMAVLSLLPWRFYVRLQSFRTRLERSPRRSARRMRCATFP